MLRVWHLDAHNNCSKCYIVGDMARGLKSKMTTDKAAQKAGNHHNLNKFKPLLIIRIVTLLLLCTCGISSEKK